MKPSEDQMYFNRWLIPHRPKLPSIINPLQRKLLQDRHRLDTMAEDLWLRRVQREVWE